ncbi:hypothetical protein ARMGADRAFT_589170 [Armillaria gallica]|uniref:Uncharacterized protein n=1 Tax=Armillaria gallica TaxID=47427 RepID=A0A2H3DY31_ARMGA|nr:hypothetical protein ARMGADRAFT_589170 [Armillaria gallica]
MVAQTDIPSNLNDDEKAHIYQFLNAELNARILYSLLYGIYTGILAVTLWNIFINKCRPIRQAVVIVIILLYTLITINVASDWSYTHLTFIENGQNFLTVYLTVKGTQTVYWMMIITATISTILADLYMIWCCWMVWGQCWLVVLLPIFSLVSAIASRTMDIYYSYITPYAPTGIVLLILYTSFNLVTTLYCTLLIIYRIVAIAGVRRGVVVQLGVFRSFIEVLVESSALYSISLILALVFIIRIDYRISYFDVMTAIAKGVAPTLFVGRAAAGHTRPREDRDRSTVSSLHFQMASAHSVTSSQLEESTVQSSVFAMDIEAQTERQVISVEQDIMVSMTSRAGILD